MTVLGTILVLISVLYLLNNEPNWAVLLISGNMLMAGTVLMLSNIH